MAAAIYEQLQALWQNPDRLVKILERDIKSLYECIEYTVNYFQARPYLLFTVVAIMSLLHLLYSILSWCCMRRGSSPRVACESCAADPDDVVEGKRKKRRVVTVPQN